MDERLINRIISAAYDDSGLLEKFRIKKILRNNPEAKRLYNYYCEVAERVHKLDKIKCPDEVLEKAEDKISLTGYDRKHILQPAAAFAVILIAAITALFTLLNRPEPKYTTAEIRTAEIQAKESLAYIGQLLNKTTSAVSNEILPEKVSKPVKKGFNIINNLLIGG
jgi:hypothetical protein